MDGWTTKEAKALLDGVLRLFAQVLRAMQRTAKISRPLLHIASPCLRKATGDLPTDLCHVDLDVRVRNARLAFFGPLVRELRPHHQLRCDSARHHR